MRTLIIDLLPCQELNGGKANGGSEYTKTVFERIAREYSDKLNVCVILNSNVSIDDWIDEVIHKKGIKVLEAKDFNDVNAILNNAETGTVFFEGIIYKLTNYKIPDHIISVGTYHGVRWMEIKATYGQWNYVDGIKNKMISFIKYLARNYTYKVNYKEMGIILSQFDYLVGVSRHSKYSLKLFYPSIQDSQSLALYSPLKYIGEKEVSGDRIIHEPYILLISANRAEKNIYRGLLAIDGLFSNGQLTNYKVVVVGNLSNTIKRSLNNISKFDCLGYVSTEELEALYRDCKVFLYPTLNEGFGIPPLEAMKYGTSCIVGADTSLTGIYGTSCYYVNPFDINEIKIRVLEAVENPLPREFVLNKYSEIKKICDSDFDKLCELLVTAKKPLTP